MTRTSPRGRRPVRRSSSTSRSSTTASAGTRRWGTSPRQSTNGITVNPLSTFRGEFQRRLLVLVMLDLLGCVYTLNWVSTTRGEVHFADELVRERIVVARPVV